MNINEREREIMIEEDYLIEPQEEQEQEEEEYTDIDYLYERGDDEIK